MNTVRNQLKCPLVYKYQLFYKKELGTLGIQFFMRLKKKNKLITTKKSNKTCQKTLSKPRSHILALKICSITPLSNTKNVLCYLLLLKIGNK